jgi:hypothetical protein
MLGGAEMTVSRLLPIGLGITAFAGIAEARAPLLNDPVRLNIGYVCGWQVACIDRQHRAMRKALTYVKRYDPPKWKIQQCNRNAARGRSRVDWIGYYNCIQNLNLKKGRAPRR